MDKGNKMVKFRSIKEVDEEKLAFYIHEAVMLNVKVIKIAKKKIEVDVPEDLAYELDRNSKAKAFFDSLAHGYKRDYLEWITSGKREATREKRLATTIEWLGEGKKKNWKYE